MIRLFNKKKIYIYFFCHANKNNIKKNVQLKIIKFRIQQENIWERERDGVSKRNEEIVLICMLLYIFRFEKKN